MVDFVSLQARDAALHHNEAVAAFALALLRRVPERGIKGADDVADEAVLRPAFVHDSGKREIDGRMLNDAGLDAVARDALRTRMRAPEPCKAR